MTDLTGSWLWIGSGSYLVWGYSLLLKLRGFLIRFTFGLGFIIGLGLILGCLSVSESNPSSYPPSSSLLFLLSFLRCEMSCFLISFS